MAAGVKYVAMQDLDEVIVPQLHGVTSLVQVRCFAGQLRINFHNCECDHTIVE